MARELEATTGPETKREAREMGLLPESDWWKMAHGRRCPRPGAVGVRVKGQVFYSEHETEELVSKTEANRRGLKPAGEPTRYLRGSPGGKTITWPVYAISDCVPKKKRKEKPAREIDLLVATFAVNRAAKRYRDAASTCYCKDAHSFAGRCSRQKRSLYELKDRGIVAAFRAGRIQCEGVHGRLAIYRGEGYCFHSPLIPTAILAHTNSDGCPITVESKPREVREPRLKDAECTLIGLADDTDGFERLELPEFHRVDPDDEDAPDIRPRSSVPDSDDDWEDWDEDEEDDWLY